VTLGGKEKKEYRDIALNKNEKSPKLIHQARMARGIHRLPKVSTGLAIPDPSGVARPQGVQPAAISYPLGYPTPYGPVIHHISQFVKGKLIRICNS